MEDYTRLWGFVGISNAEVQKDKNYVMMRADNFRRSIRGG
jgi:hypothetical protein